MSKVRDISNLSNVIRTDASGNVSFVNGSTTLATINTSGQLSGSSPVLSSSYALNADLLDGLDSTQFTLTSSFAAQTASFTAFSSSINSFSASILSYTASQNITNGTFTTTSSFNAQTASFTAFTSSVNSFTASQLVLNGKYATTGSNTFAGIQTINSNLVVTGSITAQTLVVQTITSSVDFVTGSTRFGSSLSTSTHQFTGSVSVTGSSTFSGSIATTGNITLNKTSPNIFMRGGYTQDLGFFLNNEPAVYLVDDATATKGIKVNISTGALTQLGSGSVSFTGAATFSADLSATNGFFSAFTRISGVSGVPSTGQGLELYYNSSTGLASVGAYDRGGAVQKALELQASTITLKSGGNSTMTLTSGGNVGIGGEPDQPLTVYGANIPLNESPGNITVYTTNGYGINIGASIGIGGYYNATTGKIAFASIHGKKENATANNAQGYMAFVVRNNSTGATERMRITGDGNVGIGTSSPISSLMVSKTLASNQTYLTLDNKTNTKYNWGIDWAVLDSTNIPVAAIRAIYPADNDISLAFFTYNGSGNVTERMRITSGGVLYVGASSITNSGSTMNVIGTSTSLPLSRFFVNVASSLSVPAARFDKYDNNTTTSQVYIDFTVNNQASGNGSITANGASQATFTTWSDVRLKENITNLPSQLSNIMALRPVEFDYKNGSGHQIGFIAQEVQEIYPDIVGENAEGYLTISGLSKMESRLIKAIQEQQAQINELKAQING